MLIFLIVIGVMAVLQFSWGAIALSQSSSDFNLAQRQLPEAQHNAEKYDKHDDGDRYYALTYSQEVQNIKDNIRRAAHKSKINGLLIATSPVSFLALPAGLAYFAIRGVKTGVQSAVPALTYSGVEDA